jgi:hypothetical protein
MEKKIILTAILALALVFGMTVVGCGGGDDDSGGGGEKFGEFTVTFDLDGGNIKGKTAPVKIRVNLENKIPSSKFPSPVKEGYLSSGNWYTEKNGGGTFFNDNTIATSDLTVYIKWDTIPAFILNDIPAEYNGKYAVLAGYGTNAVEKPVSIRGGNNVGGIGNWQIKAIKISNRSVSLPTWEILSSGAAARYPGGYQHTINITFFIFNTETVKADDYNAATTEAITYVTFSSVAYSERVVTKSWNSKD